MASGIIPPGSEHAAVLHALVRRRAEIGAEIERCRARLRDLQGSADHVDATIRLFNSDVRVEAIRPKRAAPTHGGAYGEVTQAMMETLHDADYPLTSRELAAAVVSRRGLDGSDRELELVMAKRVRACLRPHRLKGRVRSVDIGEGPQGWVLVNGRANALLISTVGQVILPQTPRTSRHIALPQAGQR